MSRVNRPIGNGPWRVLIFPASEDMIRLSSRREEDIRVTTADGKALVVREDIGRHNAVDKAIGRALLDGKIPLDRHLLLVSGRASFEIVQKALAAGIPIVASVSAPSSLAMNFARENNQTLIGFLRPPSFNIYSHIERVVLD